MAIDEADQPDADGASTGEASASGSGDAGSHESDAGSGSGVRVGEYTWADFMEEYGYRDEVDTVYSGLEHDDETTDQLGLDTDETPEPAVPTDTDFADVSFDPEPYLGYTPDDLHDRVIPLAGSNYDALEEPFLEYVDPETTPIVKDVWTWEHYKWEYYYDEDGSRPRDTDGEIVRHDKEDALGFDPDTLEDRLSIADDIAMELDDVVEERTVNIQDDIDEDEFFSTADGNTTVSNRYDLEKTVPMEKKTHFREIERYWVNKPYAYVVIFHSEKENEKKYYMVEPHLNEIELELQDFLSGKLRKAIKYSDDGVKEKADEDGRRIVIEDETRQLLKRYDLFEKTSGSNKAGIIETIQTLLDDEEEADEDDGPAQLEGIEVRPEPIILAEDPDTLNEYQVEKLLYFLKRNFIGYERIDGIKHDINVEDISVDGYNSPVFVYHSEYEQIISNIYHGEDELDDFVVKLAQRSGKGISKRLPQVDATLPDGSRAQLTLGQEVSDHGTNYTIRQFKDVPFTPIDLINWNTFSLDEMAFLWLAIENHKSLIFAGGTASGKTTSLNAVSLFIPSSAKIVSIEDTREVELPQRNWIASVTRPSFADDEQGDVDEFDLLEAALRQRPDYIVMGEIRGEEGRTLFQVMSTGHTTYTTFHADSVDEVLKRFTTDPINVSKTMFTALDLVSIQTQTRVQGRKVRRNKSLTEINHYEAEHDEINVQDVYQWQAETDEFLKMGDSNTLEEIQFDRGWSTEKLENELFKREVILAYLIKNGLNTYAEVAATVQAFINDPDTILTLIANGQLEDSLEDLREMESVLIDVDQEKEELVPRPDATSETYNLSMDLLERAEESLFEEYRGKVPSGLASALGETESEEPIEVENGDDEFDFAGDIDDGLADEWTFGDGTAEFATTAGTATAGADDDEPDWFDDSDDSGFGIEATAAETGPSTGSAPAAGSASGPAADSTANTDTEPLSAEASAEGTAGGTTDVPDTADEFGSGEPPAWNVDESAGDDSIFDDSAADASQQSTAAGHQSSTSGATAGAETKGESNDDVTVFPSDDPDDSDFGGLFDDMGETLDELESTAAASSAVDGDTERVSTADGDAMFSGDELEDVFDPDPEPIADDGEGDTPESSESLESPVEPEETGEKTTDDETETATETAESTPATAPETTDEAGTTERTDASPEDEGAADGDTNPADTSQSSDDGPSVPDSAVPSIELGSGTPVDERGPGAGAGPGSGPGAGPAGETTGDGEDVGDDGVTEVGEDETETEDEDEDKDNQAEENMMSFDEADIAVDDGDAGATDANTTGEESTSIFGDQSDPVFAGDDPDADAHAAQDDPDGGSLFDDAESGPKSSIFADDGDADDVSDEPEDADTDDGATSERAADSDDATESTDDRTTSTDTDTDTDTDTTTTETDE
ncbi:type II secretion system protein E [Natrialba hulunbeirensis JCM 10989]|uniref:Type II secretion system protein E n=1 Tax=Natrialba hulunbeirensis JCM 10989 TaxID=1227493 RepID=L9ZM67_9EURY|nr:ATPase, T2SS/T4P/T4SS family [Natrialba hulunbeirensis]ELY87600.1 type II secretion system protein E [Natrialba hulunbeirensis JCM 10989]